MATDFTGVTIPFSVNDLLTSSSGLLGLVGSFIALALAFVIVPKIINLIKSSLGKAKSA